MTGSMKHYCRKREGRRISKLENQKFSLVWGFMFSSWTYLYATFCGWKEGAFSKWSSKTFLYFSLKQNFSMKVFVRLTGAVYAPKISHFVFECNPTLPKSRMRWCTARGGISRNWSTRIAAYTALPTLGSVKLLLIAFEECNSFLKYLFCIQWE